MLNPSGCSGYQYYILVSIKSSFCGYELDEGQYKLRKVRNGIGTILKFGGAVRVYETQTCLQFA